MEGGRKGRGRGRDRAEEQTRTSLAGTQGGASPQTRAPMRKSPPFLERPRRRERGRSEGEGEAFASQREGNGIGMGRGREQRAGGRVDRGTQQQQTRPHARAVGAGGGCGQGQAAGRRRHSVSRPANTPHRQQRGAGAVEGQSTAKPQLAAPKGGKGPQGLSEASGPVPRRARRRLGLPAPLRSGFRGGVRVFRTTI